MATTVLRAPVGTGKTGAALARIRALAAERPFARVWVLVATTRQEYDFRERLMAGPEPVFFNVEFFNFYQLYHRLLNIAQRPPLKLDQAARFGLLRGVLKELTEKGKLKIYGPVAETPGFLRIMAELIYELKQLVVTPENFAAAARTDKDRELAQIYSAYQQRLIEHNLVDREGEGWLALAALREDDQIGRDVDLLIVDGYDQFTPLQAQLLMRLADRVVETFVTLMVVPDREATVGRRFEDALATLQQAAQDVDVPAPVVTMRSQLPQTGSLDPSDRALTHLCTHILRSDPPRIPAGDAVTLIEAPDPAREVEAVLRRVKRLLLDGCPPDDILIALRDWGRYANHFATLGRSFGLPLALHGGEPLLQNPAALALLELASLHEDDFRRRALLDVLRSPYFTVPGLDAEAVARLEALSTERLIAGGRRAWLDALEGESAAVRSDEDDTDEPVDQTARRRLSGALRAFFDAVTPPQEAAPRVYVRWLDALIGPDDEFDPDDDPVGTASDYHLGVIAGVRRESASGIVERDLAAVEAFKRALRDLARARDLLGSLGESGQITREDFLTELRTALTTIAIERRPPRAGRVLVTTVTDARGLRHRHVFIPGLSEGVFPQRVPESPLYLDSERAALAERGIPLEAGAARAADDSLFYQLIGLAHESLTLSRPTVQDGAPWIASHLWRAIAEVFEVADSRLVRVPQGGVVTAAEVATPDEVALALAGRLNAPVLAPDAATLHDWLLSRHGPLWQRIVSARRIELGRLARGVPHDRYSGRLRDPALIAVAARALGPDRLWSASQLNDYGYCGFRFFAKRLLRLEAVEEPEEGPDAAKLGTVHHEILERVYAEVGRRGLNIEPDALDAALAILAEIGPAVLAAAPDRLGFRVTAQWEAEREGVMRRLEGLLRLDFSEKHPLRKLAPGPRRPYRQEASFGTDGGPTVAIPIEVDGVTELLTARGYIDRMDQVGDGVVLVDYKTGSTPIPVTEMMDGRNFQMMLYLLAAHALVVSDPDGPSAVLGGAFWHIRGNKPSGTIAWDEEGEAAVEVARGHLGRYIAAGRRGDFSVQPRKADHGRCNHYCEYAQLCRLSSTNQRKTES